MAMKRWQLTRIRTRDKRRRNLLRGWKIINVFDWEIHVLPLEGTAWLKQVEFANGRTIDMKIMDADLELMRVNPVLGIRDKRLLRAIAEIRVLRSYGVPNEAIRELY